LESQYGAIRRLVEIAAPDQNFSETNNIACGASPAASASERCGWGDEVVVFLRGGVNGERGQVEVGEMMLEVEVERVQPGFACG